MGPSAIPVKTDIVLVGAGHAHVQVLRAFGMKPEPGVRLTLITRQVETPYSGMLPGHVAGAYTREDMHIDAAPLSRFAGARLYHDEMTGLDPARRRVLCAKRGEVPYDFLSIDFGSMPNTGEIPGAAEFAIPVKPIDSFLARLEPALRRLAAMGKPSVSVVGAGAGGVELIFALEKRLRDERARAGAPGHAAWTLLSGSPEILPGFPEGARRRVLRALHSRGIAVRTSARVAAVEEGAVLLKGGERLAADAVFWTTQAAALKKLGGTGLELDERGFIKIDESLRALGQERIFAAGDAASFSPRPLPKSGVYAVRAGPVLAGNLRRAARGEALLPFKPQADAMYLLSTADGSAIGARNGFSFEGRWAWRWKDWIDRRFMRRFNEPPDMAAAAGGSDGGENLAMRCGGCGAKTGASVLSSALSGIAPLARPEIVAGLAAADDAAVIDTGGKDFTLQTVDYFRAPFDDPWLFGRIAANHALSDIFAMGGEPVSALAIATLPYGAPEKTESDLAQMMGGANLALTEAGCALAGGHTSEGAELALGFAVTGLAGRNALQRKGGLRAGEALILTKPLGTGVILAAHMRGKAGWPSLSAAIESMLLSNRAAAGILQRFGASAMTDVTGFGLIGHLAEMLKASGMGAELKLGALPVLSGAKALAASGIASTMQPENLKARHLIANLAEIAAHPLFPLLFDPQTAGGLLAGIPAASAAECVAALGGAGCAGAAVIGRAAVPVDSGAPLRIILSAS